MISTIQKAYSLHSLYIFIFCQFVSSPVFVFMVWTVKSMRTCACDCFIYLYLFLYFYSCIYIRIHMCIFVLDSGVHVNLCLWLFPVACPRTLHQGQVSAHIRNTCVCICVCICICICICTHLDKTLHSSSVRRFMLVNANCWPLGLQASLHIPHPSILSGHTLIKTRIGNAVQCHS